MVAHVASALKYGHGAPCPYGQVQFVGHMSENGSLGTIFTHLEYKLPQDNELRLWTASARVREFCMSGAAT